MEVIDSVIIRGQQDFEKHDKLNPIEIKVYDGKIINFLKKHKKATFRFIPVDLLFSRGVKTNTEQIFIISSKLNDVKIYLINRKIWNNLALINLQQVKNSKIYKVQKIKGITMKGATSQVNVPFD